MALPAPLQALFDRLQTYNSDAYNASSNPGGFARGGNQKPIDNFIKSIRDFTAFGRGISDNVDGSVDAAAASASAAAADRVQTGQDRTATGQDRASAAQSASDAAEQAQKLIGTSATSVTPGTGARTFTTQAGKYFAVGTFLTIVSTAAPTTRWMAGQVTAYNATTGALTVNVEAIGATTSAAASWNIYLGGPRGAQGVQGIPGIATMPYLARSSNTQLVAGDSASLIDATGTFTQTFAAPAALGANWYCFYKNAGTGQITIPASDGVTNWIMYPGEMRLFQCDGTTLRSEVLNPFSVSFIASGIFIKPPGYVQFEGLLWGGGGGGSSGGGGGGACTPFELRSTDLSQSTPISIGAGGPAASGSVAAGNSTFGPVFAGGGFAGPNSGGSGGGIFSGATNLAGGGPAGGLVEGGGDSSFGGGGGGRAGYASSRSGSSGYGGGGGQSSTNSALPAGGSLYGGGGGASAGATTSTAGVSMFGGNGGSPGQAGFAPGGGGGSNAAGARGELRISGVA